MWSNFPTGMDEAKMIATVRRLRAPLLLAALILAFTASSAFAQGRSNATLLEDRGQGVFAFRSAAGGFEDAPLLAAEIDYRITGVLARARVTQHFLNPHDGWREGIYVFPLPETAAVDSLTMRIGDKVIEGQIKRREQAGREYRQAADSGQRAALLDQERPNIFTASVANIAPGASIAIEFEYQHPVDMHEGVYALRLPLVVGPRYLPASPAASDADGGRISPPVRHPSEGAINPVQLSVTLTPGFPVAAIESASHALVVVAEPDGSYRISIADGIVPADRDFAVSWTPAPSPAPRAAIFKERIDGETYLLGLVTPPAAETATDTPPVPVMPREVVFVVDTSGSMSGTSMPQAKAALDFALRRLRPEDRFNVIRFADHTSSLYERAVPADREHVLTALGYAASLNAAGGTEMMPALLLALRDAPRSGYLKQVVFITDGDVGNEADLLETVASRLATARLFTVGIGSAPNGYFLRKAAELGRGSFTIIDNMNAVEAEMSDLFAKLEHPLVTDLAFNWLDAEDISVYPDPLPDLYAGEPLIFTARLAEDTDTIALSGRIAGRVWRDSLPVARAHAASGIAKMWARDRIDYLNDAVFHGADPDFVEKRVTDIALDFGLITRHTSLVAIDVTPVRPADEALGSGRIPTNLPDGWVYESVFGDSDAAPAPVSLLRTVSLDMPQGATPAELYRIAGLAVIVAGLAVLLLRRRTRRIA
jgi:Ca-activated chloride channel family protein